MNRCESCMTNPVHPDKKCCFNCARVNTDCEVWHNCGEDCPGWDSKVKTNADRIRAMTDEELAELFRDIYNAGGEYAENWYVRGSRQSCFVWDEEWLKQPAEVE